MKGPKKEVDSVNDSEIIELFWQRSEEAISAVQIKYGASCMSLSRNIVSSTEDAEECFNDALLCLWSTIPPERPRSLMAYLYRIVRNISIHKYNYNHAKKRDSFETEPLDELYEYISDEADDSGQLKKIIEDFLETLDKKSRIIFVRRYWFSDTVSAIAKKAGMTENAVSQRIYVTKEKFRKYLKKEGIAL